jgi:hypothetical protein
MKIVKIAKKSGGTRTIYVQDPRSCGKFREVATLLTTQCQQLAPAGVVRGFMPGESPVTNAAAHASSKFILNMDLADFFDHCDKEKIAAGLMPLDVLHVPDAWLPVGKKGAAKKSADELAARAVYDGAARQGLSSSPMAANIAALPMDRDILSNLPANVIYTRYADDLTFSADDPALLKIIRQQVPNIAKRHGQEVKPSKTRMQAAVAGRMVVTGVAVAGGKLHATKEVRRRARAAAHNCKKLVLQIADFMRAGQPVAAGILWRANWRQFSRARGLAEWCKLTLPKTHS